MFGTYTYELFDIDTGMRYLGSRTKAWIRDVYADEYYGTVKCKEFGEMWNEQSHKFVKSILNVWNYTTIGEYQEAYEAARAHERFLIKQSNAHNDPRYYNVKPGPKK